LVRRFRALLEWEIVEQPRVTKLVERTLAPVLGKSLVLYGVKPGAARTSTRSAAAAVAA